MACNFIKKEALAQVFSCEFCEISKNTFIHKILLGDCFLRYVALLQNCFSQFNSSLLKEVGNLSDYYWKSYKPIYFAVELNWSNYSQKQPVDIFCKIQSSQENSENKGLHFI